MNRKIMIWSAVGIVAAVAAWQFGTLSQTAALGQSKSASTPAPDAPAHARFEFQVNESVDSKYLGDTPSHRGRSGLKGKTPNLALHDPVYRGKVKVGHVTALQWDKLKEALDVEFNPEPFVRISVGDTVWVVIDVSEPPRSED